MPAVATRSDALRFELSGTEVQHLTAVGEIPGVIISAVAARNGVGTGRLRSEGDGKLLSWRAPGSSTFGATVNVSLEGNFILEDGEDHGKWLRIAVTVAFLVAGPTSGRVFLKERYENAFGDADVTAAEASAGDVKAYTVDMKNDSARPLRRLAVWLDASAAGLKISDDGATWVAPTTEAAAQAFPDLVSGGTDVLHVQRTISAGASADPQVLNLLHARYFGLW